MVSVTRYPAHTFTAAPSNSRPRAVSPFATNPQESCHFCGGLPRSLCGHPSPTMKTRDFTPVFDTLGDLRKYELIEPELWNLHSISCTLTPLQLASPHSFHILLIGVQSIWDPWRHSGCVHLSTCSFCIRPTGPHTHLLSLEFSLFYHLISHLLISVKMPTAFTSGSHYSP